jgi:hypothetical protein
MTIDAIEQTSVDRQDFRTKTGLHNFFCVRLNLPVINAMDVGDNPLLGKSLLLSSFRTVPAEPTLAVLHVQATPVPRQWSFHSQV